jgi:hypothetical protein
MRKRLPGVKTIDGRLTPSVVVAMGRKYEGEWCTDRQGKKYWGKAGMPVEKDRFHILSVGFEPEPIKGSKAPGLGKYRHPPHPEFGRFHAAPVEERRTLRGHLLLPRAEDCHEAGYVAPDLERGRGAVPDGGVWGKTSTGAPACIGDGERAQRHFGDGEDGQPTYQEVPCRDRTCIFRKRDLCKPLAILYFQLDGTPYDAPRVVARFQSRGYRTVEALKGFFEMIEQVAKGMALAPGTWDLTGLPFEMHIGMAIQPKQDKTHKFPTATFSPIDLPSFLQAKARSRQTLMGLPGSPLLLESGEEADELVVERQPLEEVLDAVAPRGLPAVVAVVPPAAETEPAAETPPPVPKELTPLEKAQQDLKGLRKAGGVSSAVLVKMAVSQVPGTPDKCRRWVLEDYLKVIEWAQLRLADELDELDPRSTEDRIREIAGDMDDATLDEVAKKVAGVPLADVPPLLEADVIAEVERRKG